MSQRIFGHLIVLALMAACNALPWSVLASGTSPTGQAAGSVDQAPAANELNKANFPDPTHIPFILPQDIPWEGRVGHEQHYNVTGDPTKPGPYIQLLKWWPGNFSKPHFHTRPRYITVLSGTWWVSSSTHFDPDKTYPLPAGTLVQDIVNTVHWDGAKAGGEPVVLEIVGEGPVPNVNVDENGKPIDKSF